jgi:hypothetical protein
MEGEKEQIMTAWERIHKHATQSYFLYYAVLVKLSLVVPGKLSKKRLGTVLHMTAFLI